MERVSGSGTRAVVEFIFEMQFKEEKFKDAVANILISLKANI